MYLSILYKTKLSKQRDSVSPVPSCDETTHQAAGKGFPHAQHLGSVSTFGNRAYQARSTVGHHNILWMILIAEKTSKVSLNK